MDPLLPVTLIPFRPDLDWEGAAKESCSNPVDPSAAFRTAWRVSCGARKGLWRDAKAERWVRGLGRIVRRAAAVCWEEVSCGWEGGEGGTYDAAV